jgi:phosphoribosylformylglycinamidine cyclo-ligase
MDKQRQKMTYEDAGVSIDKATRSLRAVKDKLASTFNDRVLSGMRHFGSMYSLAGLGGDNPVLVASADGVGTKLKVAFMAGRHNTVGIDIVNHCVNDIVVQGARPLFFLDYLAVGKLRPEVFEEIVDGLVAGCRENGIALIGGETAEMPDFYSEGEYDLAGFIMGMVDRDRIIDGSDISRGDLLIGLASSGLHTNGYSLVRKVFFEIGDYNLESVPSELSRPLADELLEPHMSYLKAVDALRDVVGVKAMIHVTGGGFVDNIPRVLPEGFSVGIDVGSWQVPGIFRLIVALAGLDMKEAFRTFNMGIGFIFVMDPVAARDALPLLKDLGYVPSVIGEVERGEGGVQFEGT